MNKLNEKALSNIHGLLFIGSSIAFGFGIVYLLPNRPDDNWGWFWVGVYFLLIGFYGWLSVFEHNLELKPTEIFKQKDIRKVYSFAIKRVRFPKLCVQCAKDIERDFELVKMEGEYPLPLAPYERSAKVKFTLAFPTCSLCYAGLQKHISPVKNVLRCFFIFMIFLSFAPWLLDLRESKRGQVLIRKQM